MAVDVKKLFNEELPAALAKNAEDARTIGAKYQMNITGEELLVHRRVGHRSEVRSGGEACRAAR